MDISIINGIPCVAITPFKVNWQNPSDSSMLGIKLLSDNMFDTATLEWFLLMHTNNGWEISDSKVFTLNVGDYSNWDGSTQYIFERLLLELGLQLLK